MLVTSKGRIEHFHKSAWYCYKAILGYLKSSLYTDNLQNYNIIQIEYSHDI